MSQSRDGTGVRSLWEFYRAKISIALIIRSVDPIQSLDPSLFTRLIPYKKCDTNSLFRSCLVHRFGFANPDRAGAGNAPSRVVQCGLRHTGSSIALLIQSLDPTTLKRCHILLANELFRIGRNNPFCGGANVCEDPLRSRWTSSIHVVIQMCSVSVPR